jgi:hypothetical protein
VSEQSSQQTLGLFMDLLNSRIFFIFVLFVGKLMSGSGGGKNEEIHAD